MSNTTTTTTTEASTIAADNKHLVAFDKATAAFGKAAGTYKQHVVKVTEALRAEGHEDKEIRKALRAVVDKHGVSRQHLNRILVAPTSEGGCGMEAERNHSKSGSKSVKAGLAKDAAKGGVTVNLKDAASLFAALLVEFDGKPMKVMLLAEKLNELATEAMEKAKPSKAK